jgi:hypothetical protein
LTPADAAGGSAVPPPRAGELRPRLSCAQLAKLLRLCSSRRRPIHTPPNTAIWSSQRSNRLRWSVASSTPAAATTMIDSNVLMATTASVSWATVVSHDQAMRLPRPGRMAARAKNGASAKHAATLNLAMATVRATSASSPSSMRATIMLRKAPTQRPPAGLALKSAAALHCWARPM